MPSTSGAERTRCRFGTIHAKAGNGLKAARLGRDRVARCAKQPASAGIDKARSLRLRGERGQHRVEQATFDGGHLGVDIAGRVNDGVEGSEPVVHDEGEAMSPAIGVAPHSPSFAADDGGAGEAQTRSCPRATSSRTTGEPIEPVPPSTKTRMIVPCVEACPLNEQPREEQTFGSNTALQRRSTKPQY